ncbi:MAG: hypothetical protein QM662_06460 [Gordonia sp. (in: high G+C Gram-positive bacteria)]
MSIRRITFTRKRSTTTTDPWAVGFTGRGPDPATVAAPMAAPLPPEVMAETSRLHRLVEAEIDRLLPALDDGHPHILDAWLHSQLAGARAALDELIAHQDRIADELINKATDRAERAERRHHRRAQRVTRLAKDVAILRGDLAPRPPATPEPPDVGESAAAPASWVPEPGPARKI